MIALTGPLLATAALSPFQWLALVFVLCLVLGMPVAYAVALAALAGYHALPNATPTSLVETMAEGPQKISLLAIPFFIVAGALMGQGGIARRLIDFSRASMGGLRGGTAHVNVLSSMFFGGISGSAVADVSSIGSVLMPAMEEEGYDKGFTTALTVSSSTIGLIIPPSNTLVLYAAVATGVLMNTGYHGAAPSTDRMFFAGFVPGILVGVALMAVCAVLSARRGYPRGRFPGLRTWLRRLAGSVWAFGMVLVILGGIVLGWFTAEESAAVAVLYALAVVMLVYRELHWRALPGLLREALVTTGVVMFLIAASTAMSIVFEYSNLSAPLRDLCLRMVGALDFLPPRLAFLLIFNVLMLAVGVVLDMTPAVLIFTPLFLPVALSFGVDPVHFGIILLINLCLGLCTPPVGNCLFVGCGLSRLPLAKAVRPLLPFYAAMLAVLAVVCLWDNAALWLPRLVEARGR